MLKHISGRFLALQAKPCKFKSTLTSLSIGKSLKKKKLTPTDPDQVHSCWSVVGYSTANQYNLLPLCVQLKEDGVYQSVSLVDDLLGQCLCVKSAYQFNEEDPRSSKHIFFFPQKNI